MRYRLYPTPAQAETMLRHCADARFMWNLALEQWNHWQAGFSPAPGYVAQARQLTEARAASSWLAEGSVNVQQQALRDFDQAKRNFFAGTHRRPRWRSKGRNEGFRIVNVEPHHVRRLNRRWAQVHVPKVGWVRFRWSRAVPPAKSFRVTLRAGQWHVAFAVRPDPIPGPGDGSVLGIDRGVAIPFACSDGTSYRLPEVDRRKATRLQRQLSRRKKSSGRRRRARERLAKVRLQERLRRKDAVERATTDLARRADFFRIEKLDVKSMTRSARGMIEAPGRGVAAKAGLNRSILAAGWTLFARRLEDKAPNRVEQVPAAFTSLTCSACGTVDREARESQAAFRCRACGYAGNADQNAARNIAAGYAVTARGGAVQLGSPTNREPQPAASLVGVGR